MTQGELPQKVVVAARCWIGTPYFHQASTKGVGADCLGLLRGVWREVIGEEPQQVPPYTPDWSEASGQERLWQAARQHLKGVRIDPAQPGEVALFRMKDQFVAKHLGILASLNGMATLIHAYCGHGVVETTISPPWARRIVAQFQFPDRSSLWLQ